MSISESAGASFCEGLEDVFINPTVRNMSQNTVLFDSIIAEVSDETEKLEQDNGYLLFQLLYEIPHSIYAFISIFFGCTFGCRRYSRESI